MFSTLREWLEWLKNKQTDRYQLGLDRVKIVAEKCGVLHPTCPVITVAGTNGKGSTVQGLASIYQAAGYRVGTFTSPVLLRHNEQVCIAGKEVPDQAFVDAFNKVDKMRGATDLTPFEYQTLAALIILNAAKLNVMILEVGLGGRLDAVNMIDPACAVITTISLDHCEYLGETREAIALEKAGIFRPGVPAVCGDPNVPSTLKKYAAQLGVTLYCQGRDFGFEEQRFQWRWYSSTTCYNNLPKNALAMQNMSTVLQVITLMQALLPVSEIDIQDGLKNTRLKGRCHFIQKTILEIYDVAHNPESVAYLKGVLLKHPCQGKTFAVFSMLKDKDIVTCIKNINDVIDEWMIAPLTDKRGSSLANLKNAFRQAGIDTITLCNSPSEAYERALAKATPDDRIVVFGSFKVVEAVFKHLGSVHPVFCEV